MVKRIPPVTREEHKRALEKGPSPVDYCMYLFYDKVPNAPGPKYVQYKLRDWFQMEGRKMIPPKNISFIRGCQMVLENNIKKFGRVEKK